MEVTEKCKTLRKRTKSARSKVVKHKKKVKEACAIPRYSYVDKKGQRRKRCAAKTKTGVRCKRFALLGTLYCAQHTSAPPSAMMVYRPKLSKVREEFETRLTTQGSTRIPTASTVYGEGTSMSDIRRMLKSGRSTVPTTRLTTASTVCGKGAIRPTKPVSEMMDREVKEALEYLRRDC